MQTIKVPSAKKAVLLVFMMIACASTYGQADTKAINEQVWKPFTEAIMQQDADKFISVHSKDVIRVERDAKKILSYTEYRKGMDSWTAWRKQLQDSRTKYVFELRFTERISNGDVAHEVGYFKNETTSSDGQVKKSYGKFHVVLRKENGTWKILVDSDSNEGRTITESTFLAASPLE
jgi:ketosteroid isomerase-like protein